MLHDGVNGLALVYVPLNKVVQFISYGSATPLTAVSGVAVGMTSSSVGTESPGGSDIPSLGLAGSGNQSRFHRMHEELPEL